MKFLKSLFMTVLLLGSVGYGIYFFGTNWIADKVMAEVTGELGNSSYLEEAKQAVRSDPELKQFIEEGANVDINKLPFTTKEQAARVLIKKIGISELIDIQSKAQHGMTENEIRALIKRVEGKLTDEEILAIKAVAYNELMK